jgi:recombination protein RecA
MAMSASVRAAKMPRQFLKDNPDVALSIEDKIRAGHGLDFGASPEDGDADVMEA